MNILMIYPKYPDTYWSFKHALKFVSKKAAVPPLGLITVSAMLPNEWNKKLVDLNVEPLKDTNLQWADYAFISGMYVQKKSARTIIDRCLKQAVPIVAGGPLFTQDFDQYPEIDHFVLNEGEITLNDFVEDVKNGTTPKKCYRTPEFAEMHTSPVPDFHLLNLKAYAAMNIQVSRGCPYNCDFCEITALLGRKVRMKSTTQLINELQTLYDLGWRESISIVDDNFIGKKGVLKKTLLPAMTDWMKQHKYPFNFSIQASIELADDDALLDMLCRAGVQSAFIGIETPSEASLHSCHKGQNEHRNLIADVKHIQQSGIQVSGGFIVGFDSDEPNIFQRQIDFIQKSGIVSAMVGLLNAPKNTRLYEQMEKQGRLTEDATGDNTDFTMNFMPKMDPNQLIEGYERIIQNIYEMKPFYRRIRNMLKQYKRPAGIKKSINMTRLKAFARSIVVLGIAKKGRWAYWHLLLWTLLKKPALLPDAITYAVYGYHYRTIYGLRGKNKT